MYAFKRKSPKGEGGLGKIKYFALFESNLQLYCHIFPGLLNVILKENKTDFALDNGIPEYSLAFDAFF